MTSSEEDCLELAGALMKFAIGKAAQFTEEQARINATYLIRQGYTLDQVRPVLTDMFGQDVRIPLASEVIKRMRPGEKQVQDESVIMAGTIIEAVYRYGKSNTNDAKRFLGNSAWNAVKKFGGWDLLCRMDEVNIGVARAQLTKICRAISSDSSLKAIGTNSGSGKMLSIGEILKHD